MINLVSRFEYYAKLILDKGKREGRASPATSVTHFFDQILKLAPVLPEMSREEILVVRIVKGNVDPGRQILFAIGKGSVGWRFDCESPFQQSMESLVFERSELALDKNLRNGFERLQGPTIHRCLGINLD